jgi:exosortase
MNSQIKGVQTYSSAAKGISIQFRILALVLFCVLPFVLAWNCTRVLFALILTNDTFSQIPLIPCVTLFLLWTERKNFPSEISSDWIRGCALITAGTFSVSASALGFWQLSAHNQSCLFVFGVVLIWLGAFTLFLGRVAFSAARFSLLFLIFMIPIPEPLLSKIIYWLQLGSADIAELFFKIGGVPYLRQGFVFVLPGVSIRVAEECSGIRSSMALLITTVLAAHLFLRTTWKKVLLCALVMPLAIIKNGVRIMVLSTLAIYVNPGFLYGNLHHHGGIVFFMLGLALMVLLLALLQKSEKSPARVGNLST